MYIELTLLLITLISQTSTEEPEVGNETQFERKFRTWKYNDIWKKALRKLNEEDLETLGGILGNFDKSEIHLKHQKAQGGDYDKELEQTIRKHLAATLERYGLYQQLNKKHYEEVTFEDQRINTLWTQVLKEEAYDVDEIATLYEEFDHMQNRINGYRALSERVEKHEDSLNEKMENDGHLITDNYVDAKDQEFSEQAQLFKKLKKQQGDTYHELKEHVQILENKVKDLAADPSKTFSDPRVAELWNVAKKSGNFNEQELDTIKDELKHFQQRVSKLRHWERLHDNLHKSVHEDGYKNMFDEYKEAKEKVKHHKKFVKKLHATMMDRVYQHSEL